MWEKMSAITLPLAGLRVLDLTRALAGPFCQMLGDIADIVKVDSRRGRQRARLGAVPGRRGGYFLSVNATSAASRWACATRSARVLRRLVAQSTYAGELRARHARPAGLQLRVLPRDQARHRLLLDLGFRAGRPRARARGLRPSCRGLGGIIRRDRRIGGAPMRVGIASSPT
jgi:crotonobetainyl-CoA:carnitine CoA-transferase CaiB-like acyl-CoA transferase